MLNEQTFIEQLSTLVALPTLPGNVEANRAALDYVETLLHPEAHVTRVQNGQAEILLAGTHVTNTPDVGYMVHMDVVSAPPEQFKLRLEGDTLQGRGVSDMKFSVPLGVALLNELIDTASERSFTLAITTDEEIGGPEGGKHLAEVMKWRPRCLVVPDGGDNFCFVEKAKGICQLAVTSAGKPAHASRPWDGQNALNPLIRLTNELLNRYEQNSHEPNWNTTMNIGQLHGGISTNQACAEAELRLDFRFPETDSVEHIHAEVSQLGSVFSTDLTVKQLGTGLPSFTDITLPVVQKFMADMQQESSSDIHPMVTYGGSDARYFAPFDIPVLMMKPVGGDIHCDTEWISLDSTMEFYQGLRRFVGLNQ